MVITRSHLNLHCMNPPYGTRYMTNIIISNEPDDYWDVFSSGLFTRPNERPLNFLEKMDRSKTKQEEEEDETDD